MRIISTGASAAREYPGREAGDYPADHSIQADLTASSRAAISPSTYSKPVLIFSNDAGLRIDLVSTASAYPEAENPIHTLSTDAGDSYQPEIFNYGTIAVTLSEQTKVLAWQI